MRVLLPALLLSTSLVVAQRPVPQRAGPPAPAQRTAPQRSAGSSIPVATRGKQQRRQKSEVIRKGQERLRRRGSQTKASDLPAKRTRPMSGCAAQPRRRTELTQAQQAARSFQRSVTGGRTVKKNVSRLRSLVWHKKLKSAYASARRHNKPLLWIQALGSLTGYA